MEGLGGEEGRDIYRNTTQGDGDLQEAEEPQGLAQKE